MEQNTPDIPQNDLRRHVLLLGTLLQLEKMFHLSQTPQELAFTILNETHRLTDFRQALLWRFGPTGRIRVESVSGTEQVDRNSPYIAFIGSLAQHLKQRFDGRKARILNPEETQEELRREWNEWNLGHALSCPLVDLDGEWTGGLLFLRDTPWTASEITLLQRLSETFSHAWWALKGNRRGIFAGIHAARRPGLKWILIAVLALLLWMPTRQSVLAPATIVPIDPYIVCSPMNGAIKTFFVQPNQHVEIGQPLFALDDIRTRNEYEIALKNLEVAQAEYMRAKQKSFTDEESRSELLLLQARVDQYQASADYMAEQLERSRVISERNGIAVFTDTSDWIGKPVIVGEKILEIADPKRVESEIHLPVADAINLDIGADVRIFLNIAPHRPLSANLRQAAYEAEVTPQGVLAFRLKAALNDDENAPRIGLKGTAKIHGEKVPLAYYLMRRPLATLRQVVGL